MALNQIPWFHLDTVIVYFHIAVLCSVFEFFQCGRNRRFIKYVSNLSSVTVMKFDPNDVEYKFIDRHS